MKFNLLLFTLTIYWFHYCIYILFTFRIDQMCCSCEAGSLEPTKNPSTNKQASKKVPFLAWLYDLCFNQCDKKESTDWLNIIILMSNTQKSHKPCMMHTFRFHYNCSWCDSVESSQVLNTIAEGRHTKTRIHLLACRVRHACHSCCMPKGKKRKILFWYLVTERHPILTSWWYRLSDNEWMTTKTERMWIHLYLYQFFYSLYLIK